MQHSPTFLMFLLESLAFHTWLLWYWHQYGSCGWRSIGLHFSLHECHSKLLHQLALKDCHHSIGRMGTGPSSCGTPTQHNVIKDGCHWAKIVPHLHALSRRMFPFGSFWGLDVPVNTSAYFYHLSSHLLCSGALLGHMHTLRKLKKNNM